MRKKGFRTQNNDKSFLQPINLKSFIKISSATFPLKLVEPEKSFGDDKKKTINHRKIPRRSTSLKKSLSVGANENDERDQKLLWKSFMFAIRTFLLVIEFFRRFVHFFFFLRWFAIIFDFVVKNEMELSTQQSSWTFFGRFLKGVRGMIKKIGLSDSSSIEKTSR